MSGEFLSVSEVAAALSEELGQRVKPRWISTLAYDQELRDDFCPMVGGRRLIQRSYLPEVARALRRRGWVSGAKQVEASVVSVEPSVARMRDDCDER